MHKLRMSSAHFWLSEISLYVQFSKKISVMSSITSLSMGVQEMIRGIAYKNGEKTDEGNEDKNGSDKIVNGDIERRN